MSSTRRVVPVTASARWRGGSQIFNSRRDPPRPYTKVIEAKKQHLSFRGRKLDDDAATLEAIGVAPDYTLRTQSVTVSDK